MTGVAQNLAGKVAIVTGAASGIGRASARLFHARGAKIVAVDLPGHELGACLAEMPGAVALEVSVTEPGAPERIVGAALDAFGGIDLLFNNAGVVANSLAEATSDETWDHMFAVNTKAVFRICREAIPQLKLRAAQKGRARIINTASVMALGTDIGLAAYAASKHAVAGLTKTLALELGRYAITANYILPGAIYTGMTKVGFEDADVRKVWEKKAALRRLGEPEDIARAALLLASDEADFITGHGLVADGGLMLRV